MDTPVRDIERAALEDPALSAPRGNRLRETPSRPREQSRIGFSDVLFALPRGILRLLFPRLIDRYVIGELLGPFFLGWGMFVLLFVLAENLFRLATMVARGAPLASVGEILALQAVIASVYCLPMAMLLSGLMAFNRLSGDSELTAMQAGGVPNLRVIRNSLLLGLVASFGGLALNEYVVPPASRRLDDVRDGIEARLKDKVLEDLLGDKAFVYQDYDGKQLARVVIAKRFIPAEPPRPAKMETVTYMSYNQGRVEMVVEAESAEWVREDRENRGRHWWRFNDANTQMMMSVTPGQRIKVHSNTLDFALNKSPQEVSRAKKDPTEMTYRELKDYIARVKNEGIRPRVVRQLEVAAEQKLAIPFAAAVLAIIGAPLGIRRQRSTTGMGVGLSLLVILLYYLGMGSLGVLGQNGQVEPLVAAWAFNVLGLLFGLFLAWKSSR